METYNGNYNSKDYKGNANSQEYVREEENSSVLSGLSRYTRSLVVAMMLSLGAASVTWCSEDDDPGIEIVDDSVEKEADEYQKELNRLKTTFQKQDEVESFKAEDKKVIEARFKTIQKLIDLKRTWRQFVNKKDILPINEDVNMSIDDAIKTLLDEVNGFLIGNGWILY